MAQLQWVGQLADRNAPVAQAILGSSENIGNAIVNRQKQQTALKQQQFENQMRMSELEQKRESEKPYSQLATQSAEQASDKMVFDLVGKDLSTAIYPDEKNAVIERWGQVLDETNTGRALSARGMKLSEALKVHSASPAQPDQTGKPGML